MHVDRSYLAVSRFVDAWVRLMENHTRLMEVRDSDLGSARILIVSAPTDSGIAALAKANRAGESTLLCFSAQLEAMATDYFCRNEIEGVRTMVAPFFDLLFGGEELDAIYANCLFDLCVTEEIGTVLTEMWRVLKQGGHLYSVHMGTPCSRAGRAWAWLFQRVPTLSHGFHPASVIPAALDRGFAVVEDQSPGKFGFPLRYVVVQKRKAA